MGLGSNAGGLSQDPFHPLFQRSTSTGIFPWVSTCWVSLPSSKRLMPLRPCEAITIKSVLALLGLVHNQAPWCVTP